MKDSRDEYSIDRPRRCITSIAFYPFFTMSYFALYQSKIGEVTFGHLGTTFPFINIGAACADLVALLWVN